MQLPGDDPWIDDWLEAAERGDLALIVELLQSGIDVNAGNSINTTALMRAVSGGQVEVVRALLEHGADLCRENTLCHTALTCAVICSRSWEDYWPILHPDPRPLELLLAAGGQYRLYEAVLLNDLDLARTRLDEGAGVDTGEWSYNGPLLKIAADLGYLAMVDLLLDHGANAEATDDLGQTALVSAVRFGRTEIVRCLLDRGADINAVEWSGRSAIAIAASAGHRDIVSLLLDRGAERGLLDAVALNDASLVEELLRDGAKPIGVHRMMLAAMDAVDRGNVSIIRLIMDHGAAPRDERSEDVPLLIEAAMHGHVEVVRLLI